MWKIILGIIGVLIVGFFVLAFLFVQWANRPENVARFKKMDEEEAAKKLEDEKNRDELVKEVEAKRANLKLAIDEKFADNRFEAFDYKYPHSFFKLKDNQFQYEVTVYPKSSPQQFFIFSKEDFGDFAAEMNFDIWGRDSKVGLFWSATEPGDEQNPKYFQAAYSTPNGLYVEADKQSDDFDLGSFFEAATTQKMRVERLGKSLKVSINDKLLFDQTVEKNDAGKIGIYIGHRGGLQDSAESISVYIKDLKVWK